MTSTLVKLATYIVVYGICFYCVSLFDECEPVDSFFAICCWACCIALGVELFLLALQLATRQEKTRGRIYATIIRDGYRRVEDVVSITGLPYDVVKKDLRKLVKKGKGDFQGAYFNEATQEIVFTRNVPAATTCNAAASDEPAQR